MTSSNTGQAPTDHVGASAFPRDTRDRMTHAVIQDHQRLATLEIVRYDRQGRWYVEEYGKDAGLMSKSRLKTVHDAVALAVEWSDQGGRIRLNAPGGGHFDSKYRAAIEKRGRR